LYCYKNSYGIKKIYLQKVSIEITEWTPTFNYFIFFTDRRSYKIRDYILVVSKKLINLFILYIKYKMEEYNKYLVLNEVNIDILEYVKEVNNISYHIDITFIDELIEMIGKTDFCIPHALLIKYGVINNGTTKDINRMLEQYGFRENVDFIVGNVAHNAVGRHTNEYSLKPDTFKMCIMRSKNTLIYAKYYLMLERCIKYYNDYQITLRDKKINNLNNDKLSLQNEMKKQTAKIDELLGHSNTTQVILSEIRADVAEVAESNISLRSPKDDETIDVIICVAVDLLGHTIDERNNGICTCTDPIGYSIKSMTYYYTTRCVQRKSIKSSLLNIKFKYKEVIHYFDVSNGISFWNYVTNKIRDINEWHSYFNTSSTELELITQINLLYGTRKDLLEVKTNHRKRR
jgi:phage anti-repressor protein